MKYKIEGSSFLVLELRGTNESYISSLPDILLMSST